MEIYVYGTGCGAGALIDEALPAERVAAFVQTVPEAETFLGRPVVSPEQLAERKVDLIIVTTQDAAGVERRLDRLGIPAEARFYLKNSVAVRDRNERCTAAREALGDAFVDRLRRQYAVVRVPLWDDAAAPAPEDDWVRRLSIDQALNRLQERERSIIRQRYFQGRTQMEVAQEIGISQAQVSRLEKAALQTMRKYI